MQRVKGKVFERRIATLLREAFPRATVRRAQQSAGAREPDVVVEGDCCPALASLWIECQDAREPTPSAKLAQATRDVLNRDPGRVPVAVTHRTGGRFVYVTMYARDWEGLRGCIPARYGNHGAEVTVRFEELLCVLHDRETEWRAELNAALAMAGDGA